MILPQIKKTDDLFFVKKMKNRVLMNKYRNNSCDSINIIREKYFNSIEKKKTNKFISRAVKNFYIKKKIEGYSILGNPRYNRFNKKACSKDSNKKLGRK